MMTKNLTISLGEDQDYNWCADVMATTEPWITLRRDRGVCEWSLRRPHSELYIARCEGERAGFVLLTEKGLAGSPYVASVAVAEAFRGIGIGTKLLRFAEDRFPEAGNIFLCVSDFNREARKLYERLGYVETGVLKDYVMEGHDEIIMRKKLR